MATAGDRRSKRTADGTLIDVPGGNGDISDDEMDPEEKRLSVFADRMLGRVDTMFEKFNERIENRYDNMCQTIEKKFGKRCTGLEEKLTRRVEASELRLAALEQRMTGMSSAPSLAPSRASASMQLHSAPGLFQNPDWTANKIEIRGFIADYSKKSGRNRFD